MTMFRAVVVAALGNLAAAGTGVNWDADYCKCQMGCTDVYAGTGTCDAAGIDRRLPTGMTQATTSTACLVEKCNVKCSSQHGMPSLVMAMCKVLKPSLGAACDVDCSGGQVGTPAPTTAPVTVGTPAPTTAPVPVGTPAPTTAPIPAWLSTTACRDASLDTGDSECRDSIKWAKKQGVWDHASWYAPVADNKSSLADFQCAIWTRGGNGTENHVAHNCTRPCSSTRPECNENATLPAHFQAVVPVNNTTAVLAPTLPPPSSSLSPWIIGLILLAVGAIAAGVAYMLILGEKKPKKKKGKRALAPPAAKPDVEHVLEVQPMLQQTHHTPSPVVTTAQPMVTTGQPVYYQQQAQASSFVYPQQQVFAAPHQQATYAVPQHQATTGSMPYYQPQWS